MLVNRAVVQEQNNSCVAVTVRSCGSYVDPCHIWFTLVHPGSSLNFFPAAVWLCGLEHGQHVFPGIE